MENIGEFVELVALLFSMLGGGNISINLITVNIRPDKSENQKQNE